MRNSKKILFLFLLILVFSLASSFVLARELEVTYPAIGNIPGPSSTRTLLPDYVKYIFNLIVALSGIIVFGIIVFSGFRYATSAGNPTTMKDAQDQIGSAIIGMIIILSSYLLLTTINPQLVIINPILSSNEGVIVYDSQTSCLAGMASPESQERLKPDVNYIKFGVSSRTLEKLNPGAIWLYRSTDDLKVNLYPAEGWAGTGVPVEGQAGSCLPSPLSGAKSIELAWQNPGVYLCKDSAGKDCSVYTSSQAKLADGFNNNVKSVRFKNTENVKYGAVLHEDQNYEGICWAVDQFTTISPVSMTNGVSSITVFLRPEAAQGAGVTLYKDIEYQGASTGPYASDQPVLGDFNDKARSIKIDGNYMALLFRGDNYSSKCEVLRNSDPNLLIGNSVKNVLSSFKIIPVKK